MKGKKQRIWEWWYYFIKWSKMGFNASRMLFFQILYVPWIWTTKIWCSYAYFLHLIIIFNNLKSVCVTSENWNMDLKSQKLGFLARDKLRLSKKDIWCMFEHFFPLILPIFVGQTPKYSVVCFETDCAIYINVSYINHLSTFINIFVFFCFTLYETRNQLSLL